MDRAVDARIICSDQWFILLCIWILFIHLLIMGWGYCSSGGLVAYSESQSHIGSPSVDVNQSEPRKKRVVVLGTGWAGTSFLKDLDASAYDVQVVSPRNYFAFTPLLPSVTCGTVEARSIVEPVRNIIKKVSDSNTLRNLFACVNTCITRLITHTHLQTYMYLNEHVQDLAVPSYFATIIGKLMEM